MPPTSSRWTPNKIAGGAGRFSRAGVNLIDGKTIMRNPLFTGSGFTTDVEGIAASDFGRTRRATYTVHQGNATGGSGKAAISPSYGAASATANITVDDLAEPVGTRADLGVTHCHILSSQAGDDGGVT